MGKLIVYTGPMKSGKTTKLIEEYKKTKERYDNMNNQKIDLETTIEKLREIIEEMTSDEKAIQREIQQNQ